MTPTAFTWRDVNDRVPGFGSRAAYAKQFLRYKLLDHKAYINKHGEDMPEIRYWKWGATNAGKDACIEDAKTYHPKK